MAFYRWQSGGVLRRYYVGTTSVLRAQLVKSVCSGHPHRIRGGSSGATSPERRVGRPRCSSRGSSSGWQCTCKYWDQLGWVYWRRLGRSESELTEVYIWRRAQSWSKPSIFQDSITSRCVSTYWRAMAKSAGLPAGAACSFVMRSLRPPSSSSTAPISHPTAWSWAS